MLKDTENEIMDYVFDTDRDADTTFSDADIEEDDLSEVEGWNGAPLLADEGFATADGGWDENNNDRPIALAEEQDRDAKILESNQQIIDGMARHAAERDAQIAQQQREDLALHVVGDPERLIDHAAALRSSKCQLADEPCRDFDASARIRVWRGVWARLPRAFVNVATKPGGAADRSGDLQSRRSWGRAHELAFQRWCWCDGRHASWRAISELEFAAARFAVVGWRACRSQRLGRPHFQPGAIGHDEDDIFKDLWR